MEDPKYIEIANLYVNIVGKSIINLSQNESDILESFIKDYGYEKTKEILTLFHERYEKEKPKKPISLLVKLAQQITDNEKDLSNKEKSLQPEEPVSTFPTEDDVNVIVRKYNLNPDKNILNILDESLKNFYLSELIFLKIWKNLTKEEKKLYTKKALSFVKTLNISDKQKQKEALKYRIKYLIKKDFNILF
ncbi:hypothetical protein [Sulfurihydrogenibium sp.]|uniref:hypothetical protein n=1 Tax=Sulfurihydrogenibium sp. TaxID=2053621 RepID=UPI00260C8370|nr:hypothetical protein [Sulfurihydrogenibium sp.]